MPKKFIRRILPDSHKLKEQRSLRMFGKLLQDGYLWHLNRRTVPRAVAIGLFSAFMPIPMQMVLAAALAIVLRANIPVAAVLVWLTNPITIPPMFYACYKLGAWVLQLPARKIQIELSLQWLSHQLGQIWHPLLLGCFICGITAALLGHTIVSLLWDYQVRRNWLKRRRR